MKASREQRTLILAENEWLSIEGAAPHACPYLPDREMHLDLGVIIPDPPTFDDLLARGHRRLGHVFYHPACDGCRACIPLRVPVTEFSRSKSQRRLWRKLSDRYSVVIRPPVYDDTHFQIYRRHSIHVSEDNPASDPESYAHAFLLSQVRTHLVEYRVDDTIVAVSVLDEGARAFSSVYVFWDPDAAALSPGTFSALWELQWAQALGKSHYYLGYWIRDCSSMSYKSRFRPFELYDWNASRWIRFDAGPAIDALGLSSAIEP